MPDTGAVLPALRAREDPNPLDAEKTPPQGARTAANTVGPPSTEARD
nr:MAG: MC024.1R [Molluscum contagiosum virus]